MYVYKLLFLSLLAYVSQTQGQAGPDPWNVDSKFPDASRDNIPPDLRMPLKRKLQSDKIGSGEWFFKRTLAIVLKGGNTKKNEDGSVDISLQMRFNAKQWETLEDALKSTSPLTEDIFRKSVAYVEESIYKPTIVEQIVLTWTEYIQIYLAEYKIYLTGFLSFLASAAGSMWVWRHMSHKQAVILLLVIFYAYEVVISYKEVEQKEMDKFLTAVNQCKWFFWTSSCEVPPPDPLIFLKHMNPLKIGIRMFTGAVAEPFLVISSTIETILHGVTDGLWYPFDKMMYGVLAVIMNISLIFLLVLILFNWLLNIPFSLSLFGVGLSINSKRSQWRNRTSPKKTQQRIKQSDGINQETLDKILNMCSLALTNNASAGSKVSKDTQIVPSIRRSASTGRLNNSSYEHQNLPLKNNFRKRNVHPFNGSGDA